MKFIINILLVLAPLAVVAQQQDSVKEKKKDFFPTGIKIGTDVISLIRTAAEDDFSGYEFNAEVDFYRYYLVMEAGQWEKEFSTETEHYDNTGKFARIGVDVNFLLKDPDKNVFLIGMRYGRSTYSENLSVIMDDPVWGSSTTTYTNTDVNAGWAELTTGFRVKMWKFFWMGYTARYKFALSSNEPAGFISYDIPGYGKTGDNATWGFNYQILFRVPFRKQK